jgi:BirA family biotin operon repressor/biotin-[acetyl-CoA-carboxylase] ligase
MAGSELRWNADALRQQLAARWPGLQVEIVARTGSTNSDLLERVRSATAAATASAGDVHVRRSIESTAYAAFTPCLRLAEEQTDGHGRHGRQWRSERGASLTFSLALPITAADWSGLPLAIGVALAEALDPSDSRIALKWPNDLWLLDAPGRGRKLGGILIETVTTRAQRVAVIGVGLNIGPLRADPSFASGLASLRELVPDSSAPAALARIALPLADAVRSFETAGFAPFQQRYAARDLLAGRSIQTTQRDLPEGVAKGISARGELLVRAPDGRVHAVSSGEVSVRLDPTRGAAPC